MEEATPAYTLTLDQSAHLDWDWIRTFMQNYWFYTNGSGLQDILTAAIDKVSKGSSKYHYTISEVGFLRQFVETNGPKMVDVIKKYKHNFHVIGGGITSPECLVCSAEGFIRNYLVGQTWLKASLDLTPSPHCWIPDDFGHGPELPVLLSALGFRSVAFSRLVGTDVPADSLLRDELLKDGIDFIWRASDGSQILGHWLVSPPGKLYNFVLTAEGNELSEKGKEAIYDFADAYSPDDSKPPRYSGAKTPFMYIPISEDFSMPIEGLPQDIQGWNTGEEGKASEASITNIRVQQSTYDQFVADVLKTPEVSLKTRHFDNTPYWTGHYASRPELKNLHFEAVRALTAAEVIGLMTQPSNKAYKSSLPVDFWTRVDQAWSDFAPSTHHDFVTGTSPDAVAANEQLQILRGVAATARSLRSMAINALCGMAAIGSACVIVGNSLGFARTSVVEIEGAGPFTSALAWPDGSITKTQATDDGALLVYVSVPTFGYTIGESTSRQGLAVPQPVSITWAPNSTSWCKLENEYLAAVIEESADWGLASLIDLKGGGEEVLRRGQGNQITFHEDSGDLYQFGNERSTDGLRQINIQIIKQGPGLGAFSLEYGPLRVKLRTEVIIQAKSSGGAITDRRFVREYELRAGEPFVRMTTTGAAPAGVSAMIKFQFDLPVDKIIYGTGSHWTDVQPRDDLYPAPPVFRPTHDFLIAHANQQSLGAIYHSGMPAWGIDSGGALVGCLLRNTVQNDFHGAAGTDFAPHTQGYALRVPTGLGSPETCQPLQEAQSFHTPLLAARMPAGQLFPGMISARSASLAALPAASPAIFTAAKPGSYEPSSLILRMYQPTNRTLTVPVTLNGAHSKARLVTATEREWEGGGNVQASEGSVDITMNGAIATVEIAGLGRS